MKQNSYKPRTWMLFSSIIIMTALILSACNAPMSPTLTEDEAVQRAMQTLQAQATLESFQTMVAPPTMIATNTTEEQIPATETQVPATNTEIPPTNTQIPPTATLAPTNVPTVQITPVVATPTRIPPTPTPIPCDWIKFVDDVTIKDGTDVVAGTTFTKTWRLKNVGSCTWTKYYDLAFVKGDQLSAPKIVDLPKAVKPGETIDISVQMIAPSTPGDYKGHWMLANENGVRFGAGSDAKSTFWVDIDVVKGSGEVYSFASKACDAYWLSGKSNPLACPGKETEVTAGYVIVKPEPIREDGGKENEPGIITRPDNGAAGYIQGIYPAFNVVSGDEFKATIQCEGNAPKCDVWFELLYRIGSDPVVSLDTWREASEGDWNHISVDLSPLAGKSVQFILKVANGSTAEDNRALWLRPIIYRP